MPSADPQFGQVLPRIRGVQIGLRSPSLVDELKTDMLAGRFTYHEPRGQIGGVRDRRGVYYVIEGHHRMVAAFELFKENENPGPLLELLRWGLWTEVERAPPGNRPLPARNWWGAFRNWVGI